MLRGTHLFFFFINFRLTYLFCHSDSFLIAFYADTIWWCSIIWNIDHYIGLLFQLVHCKSEKNVQSYPQILKFLESVYCKKRKKKVPTKTLVWEIGDNKRLRNSNVPYSPNQFLFLLFLTVNGSSIQIRISLGY